MSAWSRVTLVGEHRKVDMVLPAQEPIGALMPEVLELLGDPPQNPPRLRHLVTAAGEVLNPGASLAERRVPDGAVLRLVLADEPIPAPVVHEVPEVVGDTLDGRLWRWSPAAVRWNATGALIGLALAIGIAVLERLDGDAGPAAVGGVAAFLALGGLVFGLIGQERLGTAMVLAGGATAAPALWRAADLHGWEDWTRWGGFGLIAAGVVLLLGLGSPLGRGGLVGGGLAAALTAAGMIGAGFGLDGGRVGAVLALACVVLLSMLLRVALSLSGLTSLDDRRGAGGVVARGDVMRALDGAHRSMVVATLSVALAAAVAGIGAAADFDPWTAGLAGLLAVVVSSRARMFPLILQKSALFASGLAIVVALAFQWTHHVSWGIAPVLGMLLLGLSIPVAVLTSEQPEHVRARLRRIMNRVEGVAVVAIVPVAVGTFGTFERLLETF
ncbi:EsaB/YukD family protein [Actinomadura litoris]|uniref:Type VII secretion integral membrane protein EccD n=1 Tax=Actinomadura litoris TaxID=2678616 RepID=A0A7K1L7L3_9ACTN|nr:EsaB/YukD family protein [Actinomadura litoris]MUN40420.1 type VII secretion integral membrane protein EccD [Actinomadura litoris]